MNLITLEINKNFKTVEQAIVYNGYTVLRDEVILNKVKKVYGNDDKEFLLYNYMSFNGYIYNISLIPYEEYEENAIQEKLEALNEELSGSEMTLEMFNNYYVTDDDIFNYDNIKENYTATYDEGNFLFNFTVIEDSENIKDVVIRIDNIEKI